MCGRKDKRRRLIGQFLRWVSGVEVGLASRCRRGMGDGKGEELSSEVPENGRLGLRKGVRAYIVPPPYLCFLFFFSFFLFFCRSLGTELGQDTEGNRKRYPRSRINITDYTQTTIYTYDNLP